MGSLFCGRVRSEDVRGRILVELAESRNLEVISTGSVPNFSRCKSKWILNITLIKADIDDHIFDCKVRTKESLSGHRYITSCIEAKAP